MEAITIAGVAVVAVGGWYATIDFLADLGIPVGKHKGDDMQSLESSRSGRIPAQRRIKQMAGMNIRQCLQHAVLDVRNVRL